jgi:endonuclease YncB( thermonuclease family)
MEPLWPRSVIDKTFWCVPTNLFSQTVVIALLLLANPLLGQEPNIHARCIGVTDGDTVKVLTADQRLLRIRLAWIDAPEKSQAFGQRAKQAMSELVFGKDVELRVYGLDKHGRTRQLFHRLDLD